LLSQRTPSQRTRSITQKNRGQGLKHFSVMFTHHCTLRKRIAVSLSKVATSKTTIFKLLGMPAKLSVKNRILVLERERMNLEML